jgi:serine/threonine-protein kinase HipA
MKMEVWLEPQEQRVGVLERADDKRLTFTYDDKLQAAARISLSMPITDQPYSDAACRGFFENLLFEGPQLDRVLDSYKLDRGDTGSLLYHLGGDCPGAISITPEGEGPAKRPGVFPDDYDAINDDHLLAIVRSLHIERRLLEEHRDPSPLAGVQGKIAVLYRDGTYYLPKAGRRAPTTHILKVSPQGDPELTRYEAALLGLSTRCGLPTTQFEAKTFNIGQSTVHAILVGRFDRDIHGNEIRRIHSEDFCQALGLAPSLKYERNSMSPDHRFSAQAVGKIATQVTAPGLFLQSFLDQTLFNLLVGNTDNHGKNSAILYRGGGTELAPLYDVVPVFMDKRVTHQFAFRMGLADYAEDLTEANLIEFMVDLGYRRPSAKPALGRMSKIVDTVNEDAAALGGKRLSDAVSEQMSVVAGALGADLGVEVRDYFGRQTRDDNAESGAWAITS